MDGMNGMMRTGALALLLAGTQLAGCGGGQAPVQAPRPVWVVQAPLLITMPTCY